MGGVDAVARVVVEREVPPLDALPVLPPDPLLDVPVPTLLAPELPVVDPNALLDDVVWPNAGEVTAPVSTAIDTASRRFRIRTSAVRPVFSRTVPPAPRMLVAQAAARLLKVSAMRPVESRDLFGRNP